MSLDIRLPNLTGSETQQLSQIKSYLYQLTQQMQWGLQTVAGGTAAANSSTVTAANAGGGKQLTDKEVNDTFGALKPLIVKSADIVNAYYEVINAKLSGVYTAQSTFGGFKEATEAELAATSTSVQQNYSDLQTLTSALDEVRQTLDTRAYIKTGLLGYGAGNLPIYGLEVGQTNTVNGEETFDRFARFTAERLSFYDKNNTEVAYISNYRLYITSAQITGTLKLGGYELDMSDGIAFKWVGGDD